MFDVNDQKRLGMANGKRGKTTNKENNDATDCE